jgi:ribosomal protein S18 acetylase RimI-like enzyme
MINFRLQVRRASAQDHRQIAHLIHHEAHTHRHLDWRPVLDWIGTSNFWVVEDHGLITAAFACPEDPPDVAWIRVFTHNPHLSALEAWSALWETAHTQIHSSNPHAQIAAIVLKSWFQNVLNSDGFYSNQKIVALRLNRMEYPSFDSPAGLRIRAMKESDLSDVAEVDARSFGPFWRNSLDALTRAYLQSVHATVAEDDSRLIGYQISTGNLFGAHLARLGVLPEAQGRGIGSALVGDLIHFLKSKSAGALSVNTQADNAASLALYRKFGFVRTGEEFPVFVHPPAP